MSSGKAHVKLLSPVMLWLLLVPLLLLGAVLQPGNVGFGACFFFLQLGQLLVNSGLCYCLALGYAVTTHFAASTMHG